MKGATEYRDSYCWFFGGQKQNDDSFEDLVRQKIDGTYVESNVEPTPKFAFEIEEENLAHAFKVPKPERVVNEPKKQRSLAQTQIKKTKLTKHKFRSGTGRAKFHNYGQGNVNPPNDDLFMTTFNIKAPQGVNPHTVMKNEIRPYILSEYARPKPVATVHIHKPRFFATPKDAEPEERVHMDGPYWVYWPSDQPFPDQYAELEEVVRPTESM